MAERKHYVQEENIVVRFIKKVFGRGPKGENRKAIRTGSNYKTCNQPGLRPTKGFYGIRNNRSKRVANK